jgi:hypothetical protein
VTRWLSVGAALLACALNPPVVTGATHAEERPLCESPESLGDKREVVCTLPPSERPRTVRFEARFGGSHDDTMASLSARLDGHPIACEAGSKTDTMGEDGDVSLHCAVTLPASARAPHVLVFALSWRHAQYTGFNFDAR